MICILALIVFGIMGIFSATHRRLAAQAFDCVFRRITLRKCQSGLDIQLKSRLVGSLMQKSPKLAGFAFKYFEVFSWLFVILTVWSIIATAQSGYNYYLYGNCNGPVDEGFCIFDPLGEHSKFSDAGLQQALSSTSGSCHGEQSANETSATRADSKQLTAEKVDTELFFTYSKGAENNVLFIGCYTCPYTREAYPTIKKLMERNDVNAVFAHFPVKDHTEALSEYAVCIYNQDKEKLVKFNDLIFETDASLLADGKIIAEIAAKAGTDAKKLGECLNSSETKEKVKKQTGEIVKTGVYGTPTVFVNGEAVVGPKQYRVYTRLLK